MTTLNMTKGLIPLPPMAQAIIDVDQRNQSSDCRGYDWLGNRPQTPKFLVVHRAQSQPNSSVENYFRLPCCPALTDLEVNSVTGAMKRFVERGDAPSGWANGVVSSPYGDAKKYLDHFGWDLNAVNRDGEACEVSGFFAQPGTNVTREDPVSDECWASLAQWFASRAHDYGITWEQFPNIPKEGGRSYITWHQEWTIGTGKICPGKTVMDGTPAAIERAKQIMKRYQTDGAVDPATEPTPQPAKYTAPLAVSWKRGDVGTGVFGNAKLVKLVAELTAKRDTDPRAWAEGISTNKSGPRIKAGEKRVIIGTLTVPGKSRPGKWLVDSDGHRLSASAFEPSLPFA